MCVDHQQGMRNPGTPLPQFHSSCTCLVAGSPVTTLRSLSMPWQTVDMEMLDVILNCLPGELWGLSLP